MKKEVILKYQELKNLNKTGTYFECSSHTIADILRKNNIQILEWKDIDKSNVNKISLYDKENNLLRIFQGRGEVGQWLIDNNLTTQTNIYNAGDIIRQRFRRCNSFELFGYIWKIEKTFDIEYYRNHTNKKARQYYYKYGKHKKTKIKRNKCLVCGKTIYLNNTLCKNCENAKRKQEAIQQREKEHNISRETLKQEIRTTPFIKLGEKYNVSDNAIRKWCKSYNLPYKSSAIKKYSDEEWETL